MFSKYCAVLILLLFSTSTYAEWVVVGIYDSLTTYADPSTKRSSGNLVKMWVMLDHNAPTSVNGITYISGRGQHEFNCSKEQFRAIYGTLHSEHLGRGTVVNSDITLGQWTPIAPDKENVGRNLLNFACKAE
jgi:hypothetical protein